MKFIITFYISIMLFGCGLSNQANQIEALEKCNYEIISADSVYVAGKDITNMIKSKSIDINNMPELAMAFLTQNIPFKARVFLQVNNPTKNLAGINQFEYKILVKGQELANGFVNQKVSIEPGATSVIPVNVKSNIYPFLSNGKTMKEIVDFLQGGKEPGNEKKGIVTLQIKPTIALGNKLVNYPGYISVEKEVSSKILF